MKMIKKRDKDLSRFFVYITQSGLVIFIFA